MYFLKSSKVTWVTSGSFSAMCIGFIMLLELILIPRAFLLAPQRNKCYIGIVNGLRGACVTTSMGMSDILVHLCSGHIGRTILCHLPRVFNKWVYRFLVSLEDRRRTYKVLWRMTFELSVFLTDFVLLFSVLRIVANLFLASLSAAFFYCWRSNHSFFF